MVRIAAGTRLIARIAVAAALWAVGATVGAEAQGLPTLTVTALSMTSSRTVVQAGATFTITIHLHVKQQVADIPWLVLPNSTNLTILGDEKHTNVVANGGTDYIETLSVAAVRAGEATLTPAFVDARDPSRGNRPFRFSSNPLRIAVRGDVVNNEIDRWRGLANIALRSLGAFAIGIVLIFAAVAGMRLFRNRPRTTYVTLPRARPVTPVQPVDRSAPVRAASAALQAVRTRENAATVRAALFTYAGAGPQETLATLLRRIEEGATPLRRVLRMAERATFVDEPNLQGAIDDLLDAVRDMGLG